MKSKIHIIFKIFIFVALILVFLFGFQSAQQGLNKGDINRVEKAIQKAALECYSIEGAYPKNLEYLKKHYGLYIQEDKYLVRYHYVASNMMPDTDVYRKGD